MRPVCLVMALALISVATAEEKPIAAKPNDATLGQKPAEGAVVLFDGKDMKGWVGTDGKTPASWPVEDGLFTVGKGSIMTEKPFGNFQLHLEFNVPYMPKATGQARGNSGVYLGGITSCKFWIHTASSCNQRLPRAIYKQVIPSVNACKPPLQWQTYDVTFHKATVESGKVVKKARVTVDHNGIKTIDDVEISPCPAGADNKEGEAGPILLQDHGNPVQYRNIWIKPVG